MNKFILLALFALLTLSILSCGDAGSSAGNNIPDYNDPENDDSDNTNGSDTFFCDGKWFCEDWYIDNVTINNSGDGLDAPNSMAGAGFAEFPEFTAGIKSSSRDSTDLSIQGFVSNQRVVNYTNSTQRADILSYVAILEAQGFELLDHTDFSISPTINYSDIWEYRKLIDGTVYHISLYYYKTNDFRTYYTYAYAKSADQDRVGAGLAEFPAINFGTDDDNYPAYVADINSRGEPWFWDHQHYELDNVSPAEIKAFVLAAYALGFQNITNHYVLPTGDFDLQLTKMMGGTLYELHISEWTDEGEYVIDEAVRYMRW
jgi:hypothetical protein